MSAGKCKAAIDCQGYRHVMERMVDLILANAEERDDVIEEFTQLQIRQQKEWDQFIKDHYDFSG